MEERYSKNQAPERGATHTSAVTEPGDQVMKKAQVAGIRRKGGGLWHPDGRFRVL